MAKAWAIGGAAFLATVAAGMLIAPALNKTPEPVTAKASPPEQAAAAAGEPIKIPTLGLSVVRPPDWTTITAEQNAQNIRSANMDDRELQELAAIYEGRGLTAELATEVAQQLMAHDALGAHTRDELGISEVTSARPLQAAVFSAVAFSVGAALPLVVTWFTPFTIMIWSVAISSLVFLALLGAVAARAGGAGMVKGSLRVLFWGAIAMAVTALVGKLFGAVV